MFCPECGAEYVEGIKECADCRKKLVKDPPQQGAGEPLKYEEILATYSQGDIALIKSMLDNEKIDYFFRGEFFNQLDPWIQPPRLYVRERQAKRARAALKGLNVAFLGVNAKQ